MNADNFKLIDITVSYFKKAELLLEKTHLNSKESELFQISVLHLDVLIDELQKNVSALSCIASDKRNLDQLSPFFNAQSSLDWCFWCLKHDKSDEEIAHYLKGFKEDVYILDKLKNNIKSSFL